MDKDKLEKLFKESNINFVSGVDFIEIAGLDSHGVFDCNGKLREVHVL